MTTRQQTWVSAYLAWVSSANQETTAQHCADEFIAMLDVKWPGWDKDTGKKDK